jgi:hypothetical protein
MDGKEFEGLWRLERARYAWQEYLRLEAVARAHVCHGRVAFGRVMRERARRELAAAWKRMHQPRGAQA